MTFNIFNKILKSRTSNSQITIEDDNDNAPVFVTPDGVTELRDELIVDLTEESPIGSKLVAISAVDYDASDDNGRVVCEITEGHGVELRISEIGSSIHRSQFEFGYKSVRFESAIFQTSRIDRESMFEENSHAWMNVSVTARDPGGQTSILKIAFRIIDSNDNRPRFEFDEIRVESKPRNSRRLVTEYCFRFLFPKTPDPDQLWKP